MTVAEAILYLQKCPGDSDLIILDPTLEDCPIEGLVRFTSEGLVGIIPGGDWLEDDDGLDDEEVEAKGVLPPPVSSCTALVPWGDACVADTTPKPLVDVVRPRGRVRSA